VPYRPFHNQNCSIAAAAAVVGERWTLLVMREILLGRRRFAEIRRQTGIATNILSDRLETLVSQGVVERERVGRDTDVFEYTPTELGLDVNPVIVALMQWGDKYMAPNGPPRVMVHTTCGHDASPTLICGHCNEPIATRDLRVRPGLGATPQQRAEGMLPHDL
jgi:DNA-binding HxlR family transcriptional regulator